MQVDQKPSPWPCVVMLVGLLLCCLTLPLYWRPSSAPDRSLSADPVTSNSRKIATGSAADRPQRATPTFPNTPPSLGFGLDNELVHPPTRLLGDNSWISLCPPPTIAELAASGGTGTLRFDASSDWRHMDWSRWPIVAAPVISPEEVWPAAGSQIPVVSAKPNPLIAAALERVGNVMGMYSITDAVIRRAVRAGDLGDFVQRLWSSESSALSGLEPAPSPAAETMPIVSTPAASSLRMIGPNDPLAASPESSQSAPAITEPAETAADTSHLATSPTVTVDETDSDPWCFPQVLFEQLDRLTRHPLSARWAEETIDELQFVTDRANWEGDNTSPPLDTLVGLSGEAARLAETTSDDRLRVELLRTHWALSRRLDCWRAMGEIHVAARSQQRIATRGSLNSLFAGLPQPPEVRPDLPTLTDNLEAYESSRDPQLARQVVEEQQSLRASPDTLNQSLAEAVEQHYRNANVRIAITADMLNRLVAQKRSEMRAVHDRIAGTPVRGQSVTHSQSFVRLEPAAGRWQLDLRTQGTVESDTLANGGRARLRSFGATDFTAQKSIVVDTSGVHVQSACVDATNYNQLAGVKTQYDWVPLFGAYARSQAVQQYRAKRPRAKAEVEAKVAAQAQDDVDRETREAVERIEHDVRTRFTNPVAQAGIEVTPIELTTTTERIVARLRVAGNHQLGSHTPRPRALSDSLASLQLHESALTNAAVSLQLDGGRYNATELQQLLREKFPGFALARPAQTRTDTVFEFAYRDAVRFRIADSRVELMVGLTGFEHEGRRTRDFIVHAFYVPVVNGLEVELVRDGPLGIEGRLGAAERARLHNVFNTVLAEDRRLPVVQLDNPHDPRLAGLMITQMVLEDGWIGMAVGPASGNRTAERSRSIR
jgi:hypothetical protein